MGRHEGTLVKKVLGNDTDKKWSDLWYIYQLYVYDKTLAQIISGYAEQCSAY